MPGSDEQLRLTTVFDASGVQAGMQQCATAVESGAVQMTTAWNKVAVATVANHKAQEDLKFALDMVKATAGQDAEALQWLATAQEQAALSAAELTTATRATNNELREEVVNFREATHAAHFLSMETGVEMPRALRSVMAHSTLAGPILEAAFPLLAAAAMIPIIEEVGTKIGELAGEAFIFSKEQKADGDAVVKQYELQIGLLGKLKTEKLAAALIGKSDEEQNKIKQQYLDFELHTAQVSLTQRQAALATAQQQLTAAENLNTSLVRVNATGNALVDTLGQKLLGSFAKTQVIDEARSKVERLATEVQTANLNVQVASVTAANQSANAHVEAADKAAAAWKKESAEYARLVAERKRLDNEMFALTQETERKEEEVAQRYIDEVTKQNEAVFANKVKALRKEVVEVQKAADEELKADERSAQDAMKAAESRAQFEQQLGLISVQQEIAIKRDALKQQESLELAAIQQRVAMLNANDPDYPDKVKALEDKKLEIVRQANQKLQQLDQQSALQRAKIWQDAAHSMFSSMSTSINGVIQGTQTLAKAVRNVGQSIVLSFADTGLRIAEDWLMRHVIMKAINAVFHLDVIAQEQAAATASIALNSGKNAALASMDAGVAAAGAFAYYSAIFPPIAPAMAAAQWAEGLSWVAAASFDRGGLVASDMTANVHKGEMVLDPNLSMFVQNAARNSAGGQKGGGGDVHFHGPLMTVSAIDSKSFEQTLAAHSKALVKAVQHGVRRGHGL